MKHKNNKRNNKRNYKLLKLMENEFNFHTLRSFYDDAWKRHALYPRSDEEIDKILVNDGRSTMSNIKKIKSIKSMLEENWTNKFSEAFISVDEKLMMSQRYRLCLGSLRYGRFGDKIKAAKQDRVSYVKRKMKVLIREKNLEPLLDISNMLLLDIVEDNHPLLRNNKEELKKSLFYTRLHDYFVKYRPFDNIEKMLSNGNINVMINKRFDLTESSDKKAIEMYSFVDNRCAIPINLKLIDDLYKDFKSDGNVILLGLGIAVCHLYYRLLENLSKYELKAEDDGYHIPSK